jgi:hypothetical protein
MAPAPTPQSAKKANTVKAPTKPPLSILGQLAQLEADFDKAPASEFGAKMPDGTYQVTLKDATVAEGKGEKSKGFAQVRLIWLVQAGALKGREFPEFITLKDENAFGRLKGRLKSMGYNYATLGECDASLAQAITEAKLIELQLAMGRPPKDAPPGTPAFQNINFVRVVDSQADADVAAELVEEGVDAEAAEEAQTPPQTAPRAAPMQRGKKAPEPEADVDSLVDALSEE